MTALLGVTVVIGLIALVLLSLLLRRTAAAAEMRSRVERVESALEATSQELQRVEGRAEEEVRRRFEAAERADADLAAARSEAADAARRAEEAEGRADDALRRLEDQVDGRVEVQLEGAKPAGQGDEPAVGNGSSGEPELAERATRATAELGPPGSSLADALWDLERLRLEREWYAIGGLPMPMPTGWDGADGNDLAAAVAVELEVIREVVGTPGHIDGPSGTVTADSATAVMATRLAGEVLRRLARGGLELRVSIEVDDEVTIGVATAASETPDDLSRLATAATRAGGRLDVATLDDGVRVEVRLPRRGS